MSPLPLPRVLSLGSQCRQRPSLSRLDSMVSWDSGQTVRKILHCTSPDPCVPVCCLQTCKSTWHTKEAGRKRTEPRTLSSLLSPRGRTKAGTIVANLQPGTLSFQRRSRSGLGGGLKATSENRPDFSGAQPNTGMPLRLEATESARKAAPRQGVQPSSQHSCTWHTVGTQI